VSFPGRERGIVQNEKSAVLNSVLLLCKQVRRTSLTVPLHDPSFCRCRAEFHTTNLYTIH